MSDMRAGPSALCFTGSWQFESVITELCGEGKAPKCFQVRTGQREGKRTSWTAWELSVSATLRVEGWNILPFRSDGQRTQTKLSQGKVKSGSSSLQAACNHWDEQPSCSAGATARAQPVSGSAVSKMIAGAWELPIKRQQTAQRKKFKAARLQGQTQDCLLPLLHLPMYRFFLMSTWGALPRRCHLADRGLSHNSTFWSQCLCSLLAQSTGELTALH